MVVEKKRRRLCLAGWSLGGLVSATATFLLLLHLPHLLLEPRFLLRSYSSSKLLGWLGWYSGIMWFRREFPTPPPSTSGGRPSLPCPVMARTQLVMVAYASPARSKFSQGPDCVSTISFRVFVANWEDTVVICIFFQVLSAVL
jgi:hypothetical protein